MSEYYVYVYLDKTKPGDFIYGELMFPFLPRYIGKGVRHRAYDIETHKSHNIGLSFLTSANTEVVMINEDISDEKAKKLEIGYIALIGRLDTGTGPLFNKTNGGEGRDGFICSDETREKMSKSTLKYYENPENRNKTGNARKGKTAGEKHHYYGKYGEEHPRSKLYIIITPDEKILNIKGLNSFCKENGLSESHMSAMANKTKYRDQHKGYRAFTVPGVLLKWRQK